MQEQETDLSFLSCDFEERSVKEGDIIAKEMTSLCVSLRSQSAGEVLRQSSAMPHAALFIWIRVIECFVLKARLWNRGPSAPSVCTQVP